MNDDAILGAGLNASQKIIDVGVIGAVCFLLIIAMGAGIRYHIRRESYHEGRLSTAQKEAQTLLITEQASHQKTREAWLEDVKEYASIGETVRNQMQNLTVAFQSAIDMAKERDRR